MQKHLVDFHTVRAFLILLAVFGHILLGDEHSSGQLDGPFRSRVAHIAGNDHIVQVMHDRQLEQESAGLGCITVASEGLIDLVTDVSGKPDDSGVPYLEAAVSHCRAVQKSDVEAVCGHMLPFGNRFLRFTEYQFDLIIMQVDICIEHGAIISKKACTRQALLHLRKGIIPFSLLQTAHRRRMSVYRRKCCMFR